MRVSFSRESLEKHMHVIQWTTRTAREDGRDEVEIVASVFGDEGAALIREEARAHLKSILTDVEFDNMTWSLCEAADRAILLHCMTHSE
jgi:hypothetical protein